MYSRMPKTILKYVLVLLIYTYDMLHNISCAMSVTFPNLNSNIIESPNNRFEIKNNIDFSGANERKFLTIQELKSAKNQLLFDYNRNVEVSWSEGSRYVFINNNFASNMANCLIFPVPDIGRYIDISKVLKNKFKALWENHHVYVKCARWWNKDVVNIEFYGYGDILPDGFTYSFKFDLNKKQVVKNSLRRSN